MPVISCLLLLQLNSKSRDKLLQFMARRIYKIPAKSVAVPVDSSYILWPAPICRMMWITGYFPSTHVALLSFISAVSYNSVSDKSFAWRFPSICGRCRRQSVSCTVFPERTLRIQFSSSVMESSVKGIYLKGRTVFDSNFGNCAFANQADLVICPCIVWMNTHFP